MVMIAAGIGAAVKWFGGRRDDADDDVQGDDPIVRALFKAVNEGDLDGFKEHVADDCRIAINSIDVAREENLKDGWDLWADGLDDVRTAFPDVRWELYDELAGKDEGKHKIAVRLVSTVTVDGEKHDFEVAGFGIVEDKKLTEWHQVGDLETYNKRRMQTGEGALGQ
ncbi:MAG: nuclear transport factor 2 family protein [Acidimicrobiia bacterium]